jgi:hypothetical protein
LLSVALSIDCDNPDGSRLDAIFNLSKSFGISISIALGYELLGPQEQESKDDGQAGKVDQSWYQLVL